MKHIYVPLLRHELPVALPKLGGADTAHYFSGYVTV